MASYIPIDRSLPDKHVDADSITDAYVAFILYCNSQFDLDIDTTTLRSQFNTVPRSDNKEFETHALWELIKKLDAKELKTWGQLALDLGVEPPDVAKGQSVQKVQQYTVRLKRWMRAMHVDAFFEYLLGKEHAYFLDVPHPDNPYPLTGRDGVLPEEDTAIRALDPSFKPKRGRRRNSDTEQDPDSVERPRQDRLLGRFAAADAHAQSARARSAAPLSALPGGQQHDPWTAASSMLQQRFPPWHDARDGPQSAITPSMSEQLRIGGSAQTPATPYPMTALPNGASYFDGPPSMNEPMSAITPSAKRRRRHGPVVSSAWPSQHNPGAKPRGRPPASRTMQDGPFSTFPSNPFSGQSPVPQDSTHTAMDTAMPDMPPPQSATSNRQGRLSLSLQVPQHTGGPIRLATPPPPTVVVNGDTNPSESDDRSMSHTPDPTHQPPLNPQAPPFIHQTAPNLSYETLHRALTTNILRTDLIGRSNRLTSSESKRLADAMLARLSVNPHPAPSDQPRQTITLLTTASWLGLGDALHIPLGPAIGHAKKINLTRFRTDAEGYEEIVPADQAIESEAEQGEQGYGQVREVFDVYWTASQGGCTGNFSLTNLELAPKEEARPERAKNPDLHDTILRAVVEASRKVGEPPDEEVFRMRARRNMEKAGAVFGDAGGGGGVEDDGIDWKSRCRALEFGTLVVQGEMFRFKERLMEEILDVFGSVG